MRDLENDMAFLENHLQLFIHKILKCRKARLNVNNALLGSKPIATAFGNVLGFLV